MPVTFLSSSTSNSTSTVLNGAMRATRTDGFLMVSPAVGDEIDTAVFSMSVAPPFITGIDEAVVVARPMTLLDPDVADHADGLHVEALDDAGEGRRIPRRRDGARARAAARERLRHRQQIACARLLLRVPVLLVEGGRRGREDRVALL